MSEPGTAPSEPGLDPDLEPDAEPVDDGPGKTRIGLWGPSDGGKSTFLAALSIAAPRARTGRSWVLAPRDAVSRAHLSDIAHGLRERKDFPAPTQQETKLRFVLRAEARGAAAASGPSASSRVLLDVVDRPGGAFAPRNERRTAEGIAKELANCDGLVYLFDPVNEDELRFNPEARAASRAFVGNAAYFSDVAETLWAQMEADGRLDGNKLPHHLAVCIAKFDAPRVYEAADHLGMLSWPDGADRPPRVDSDTASEFFEYLCEDLLAGRNLSEIPTFIDAFFRPERVRYFVSSSVGFYLHPGGIFKPDSYHNVQPDEFGKMRMRGDMRPFNVLEPVLAAARELDDR